MQGGLSAGARRRSPSPTRRSSRRAHAALAPDPRHGRLHAPGDAGRRRSARRGTELVTVALRRIDPQARGSLIDVLDECGVELLPNTAGCFTARDAVTDRAARARGVRDRLGQARGHRRRPHAAARRARAAAGRRGARRRRLHRAALHERRPDPRPAPGGRRLRGGHAARLADRRRAWGSATRTTSRLIVERASVPVILDAGVGTASRRGAGDGARLRRRAVRERDLPRARPGRDGARDPRRRRGRPPRPRRRAHPAAPARRGVDARGGPRGPDAPVR